MTHLQTNRLILRQARLTDLAALYRITSDPAAMRYWSTPPHPDLETTLHWLTRMVERDPVTNFVVECEGQVIGTCGASTLPEIGFLFHPDHWGKGFAREAMETIIPHFWATTDHPALTADVDPRNTASLGLLQRLGFKVTGAARNTFHISGEWCHSTYLALQRPLG